MKPRTLDDKQEEKDRLLTKYKAAKRREWQELCEAEPRLAAFRRDIRRMDTPAQILTSLADSWLRFAPPAHRYAALRQIDNHANRMALAQGRSALDDPFPPDPNLYFAARSLLAVR